ncbi:Hsp20/alpha crystallin family protein [Bifidobacterium vespertilionis]|uniref:Hsp20/alpha crystallin family protein n=1 Tax=Bifidobacterium vespertilionis TaxID=2562524 RepID=A0A5J5E430_9BIFI|nr:Hsp20/alpha crystallin family protein [Bifidobacterium vespertilionis]KAA8821127.1 Hsp20/alpha crystallin family protein [Bifidobacterium vespertilionis]KAA8823642.1 Hsp20/alpha crystallin family protein [Bifidobacterium vespertilionis]
MAMFPALMNDTMFSDLFDDPFFEGWRQTDNGGAMSAAMANGMMCTDVKETKDGYDVDIDMPGFKKEDINLELSNGYLTVSARRDGSHEDKGEDGKWLRRERYAGSCSRSFYVGEDMKESDIHASYKNGTLCLQVPKMDAKPQVEAKHQIAIEG